jgi:hypothetical protein
VRAERFPRRSQSSRVKVTMVPRARPSSPELVAAATLEDLVNFYDQRFNIGFTDREKADLVAFLNAL